MKSPPTDSAELRCHTSWGASQVDVAARAQMLGLISVGEMWSLANQRDTSAPAGVTSSTSASTMQVSAAQPIDDRSTPDTLG